MAHSRRQFNGRITQNLSLPTTKKIAVILIKHIVHNELVKLFRHLPFHADYPRVFGILLSWNYPGEDIVSAMTRVV